VGLSEVVEGFILATILTVILSFLGFGSILGVPASNVSFLIAGIVVGYIVYGTILDGVVNGALIGIAGAIILWVLSLFKGQISVFSSQLSSYVGLITSQEIIIVMVVGAIGGFIGSLIKRFYQRNQRKHNKYQKKEYSKD
jgi:hypothetical protein